MALNPTGNGAKLIDNRAKANTFCSLGLVVLQGSIDRYRLIADQAQNIESNGGESKEELVRCKVLAGQKLHVHVCLEFAVILLTCRVIIIQAKTGSCEGCSVIGLVLGRSRQIGPNRLHCAWDIRTR